MKQYWDDVRAGRREPPKRRGRPPKTSKQLADKQPASQAETVKTEQPEPERRPARPRKTSKPVAYKRTTYKEAMAEAISSGDVDKVIELRTGWKADPKIGRNSPCPCGSGKKFKKCCAA